MTASENADVDASGGKKSQAGSYAAPALEKGLDILELISDSPQGISQQQIAKRLNRTTTEIFRMLNVLERRNYLSRDSDGSYQLTLKLFELSHRHPPTKLLLQVALPLMQKLAEDSRQSAHLVVYHQGCILVIAQVDSPEPLSFGVKLGTHFVMKPERTSALVLTAFAQSTSAAQMTKEMLQNDDSGLTAEELKQKLHGIRATGHYMNPSQTTAGVVDVSCPIFGLNGTTVAALTVPFLSQNNITVQVEDVQHMLQNTANLISEGIGMRRT
ncbi:IclR family transcriptional regulator [Paracoccus onubensis]|uniref:IclR family transcriptional regulator n=1 Tax=Paracoccus onubensis TaxID=1675788 RepID=UPI0027320AC1|nr:IclR family transcriptional regulator [Paracoccus onubensis]MDP0928023.1 IclR family transcriptional regulator [Paracoccus onubensis]